MKFEQSRQLIGAAIISIGIAACSDAPAPHSSLPVAYAMVDIAAISTAESLTERCVADDAKFREHLALLENFDGTPTATDYYRSLDSLYTSLSTILSHASGLARGASG